jgi:hypothetical protein
MAVFILILIGVSVGWYGATVFGTSFSRNGWSTGFGAVAFICALAALVVVCLKAFAPLSSGPAGWRNDGLVIVALGALVVLFSILGMAVRGSDWKGAPLQAGGILTLIAGLLLAGCGALTNWAGALTSARVLYSQQSGQGGGHAYPGQAPDVQQPLTPSLSPAPQARPSDSGLVRTVPEPGPPPDGINIELEDVQLSKGPSNLGFCRECGAKLSPGQAFCGSCGRAVG